MKIIAAKSILKANDQLAAENRSRFEALGLYVVNVVGSPGCGKTTLLEALFERLGGRVRPAVIEGDIAGQIDADRLSARGIPVVQINTEGMCHLDANMIAAATQETDYSGVSLLVIENVGNLVCTAGYDLGEHLRVVVLSVAEGDDKLVKYPSIFQRSDALIITKTDLLPVCRFDRGRVRADMGRLAPDARVFEVSAVSGQGMDPVADWLADRCRALRPVMA
jgi:hydrogenase nickel incorporation protein HypB